MFQLNQIAGAVHALTGETVDPEGLAAMLLAETPMTVLFKDGSFVMVANARVVHGSYEYAHSFERYMSLVHDLDYAQQTVHGIEQELEAYGNKPLYVYDEPKPVVDLSTIELGDKVVYRSDRATKHPVIRVAKVPRLHYPFAIETAIHFNTYTQGGSVCTRVQGKNDIVEGIKAVKPKPPVDLSTIELGDQVVYRQGSTHTVEYVSKQDNLTCEFWVSTALFTQTYTRKGNVYKDNTSPYDIIEVIKSK